MQEALDDWARSSLNQIDLHMSVHGPEMDQLRKSGVTEHHVQSLYPFEIGDYYAGLNRLIPAGRSTEGLLTTFAFSNVWYGVAAYLAPHFQPLALEVSRQKLTDHEPLVHLTQSKLVFQNILQTPIVLRSLALGEQLTLEESNADRQAVEASFKLFHNVVEEFIGYLELKAVG